jgi:RNA polymerase sigma factor (sigma-70 family)
MISKESSLTELIEAGEAEKVLTHPKIKSIIMREVKKYKGRTLKKNDLTEECKIIVWELLFAKYKDSPKIRNKEARAVSFVNKELPNKLLDYIAKEEGKYYNREERCYKDKFKTVSLNEVKNKETKERWEDTIPDPHPSILDKLIQEERIDEIKKRMEGLTSKQKEAIQLYYFRKMTEVEVARKLGVTRGVIHSRRIRGIKKLENIFKKNVPFFKICKTI